MSNGIVKVAKNRGVRKIIGRISNSGAASIAAGAGFTILRNGTGDVTITPAKGGRVLLGAVACAIQATGATYHGVKVLSASGAAVRFGTYVADGVDGAPADIDFSFEIALQDHA